MFSGSECMYPFFNGHTQVKQTGITFSTFACLAKCQGLTVNAVHGSNSTIEEFRHVVKHTCTSSSSTLAQPTSFLVVSYTRKVVGQTGTGHFSPIGAYDEASDHVLLLDTARFKYGPHWIPLELMFDAMLPLDPDTGKSRGYLILSYEGENYANNVNREDRLSHLPVSVLFGSKKSKDFLRREYKKYLQELTKGDDAIVNERDGVLDLSAVVSFWTKNNTDNTFIWELVELQLQPVNSADIQLVKSLRKLIKNLINMDKGGNRHISQSLCSTSKMSHGFPGGECCTGSTCNSSGRVIELSPAEAVYVIYLASLPLEARRGIVYAENSGESGGEKVDNTVREQLLSEAALISYAIETCDYEV